MNVQIFHKSKNEDSPLSFRQSLGSFPDRPQLFVHPGSFFLRNAPIGPVTDLFTIDALRLFPKLKAAAAHLIANEIDSNAYQPGIDAAISPECFSAFVGVSETVLRQ